jgi:hypothetical protein
MFGRAVANIALLSTLSAGALAGQDLITSGRGNVTLNAFSVGVAGVTFTGSDAPDASSRVTPFISWNRHFSLWPRRGAGFVTGVGIGSQGAVESSGSFSNTTSITSVFIPAHFTWHPNERFFGGRARVIGGAQGSFNVSCKQKVKSGSSTSSSKCVAEATMDVALAVGAGFGATILGKPAFFDVIFTRGLKPVFPDFKVYNQAITFRFMSFALGGVLN